MMAEPMNETIFATPRVVTDLDRCYFYHTMDIPTYGLVHGEWDLRTGVDAYLGNVSFKDNRVLELGTASGFLCMEMEKRGAEVVALDLDEHHAWDIVPYAGFRFAEFMPKWSAHIARLNNGFWLNHGAHHSTAKLVYGSIYDVPEAIGEVDIATFGSILLHLRDPFLALQRALRLTRETVIVSEVIPRPQRVNNLPSRLKFLARFLPPTTPQLEFLPDPAKGLPLESWWALAPELIARMIGVLGFGDTRITFHDQKFKDLNVNMYTVVGQRTKPAPEL
jgi:hypothetical protein